MRRHADALASALREASCLGKNEAQRVPDESNRSENHARAQRQQIGIDSTERLRNGLRLGGWVSFAAGMGVSLLLSQLVRVSGLWAVGAIRMLIGVALLFHSFSMEPRAAPNR